MINVNVSVIMELTDEWQQQFDAFFKELRSVKWVNEQGQIQIPNENYMEELFSIARKYEMRIILHS